MEEKVLLSFDCKDGKWQLTKEQYEQWLSEFPHKDVWGVLLKAKCWCQYNEKKRKLVRNMVRWIATIWLSRTEGYNGNRIDSEARVRIGKYSEGAEAD